VYVSVELNDWLYLVHSEHIYGQVARTTGYNQHLSSNKDCEQNGESSFGHTTFSQYLPVNVEYGHLQVHVRKSIVPPFEQNAPLQSHKPLSQLFSQAEHCLPSLYGSYLEKYVCLEEKKENKMSFKEMKMNT